MADTLEKLPDRSTAEYQENAYAAEIEQGNGAVLLDLRGKEGALEAAEHLKTAKDGYTVLVPQPSEDPDDPLNWKESKKNVILVVVGLAAFLCDFQAGVGAPAVAPQSVQWHMSPNHVNYANNLNVLMVGIGGVFWIPFIYFWGRAPVLFYLTLTGTMLTLATALVQDFNGYYATHALMGFLYGGGQTLGLAYIQDMFYLHQQARKIGIWAAMLMGGPLTGALFAYFILAGTGEWRPMYWTFFGASCLLLGMVVMFGDESWYRRDLPRGDQPVRGSRLLRLLGVWQIRVHGGYFMTVRKSYERVLALLIKPIMLPILCFYSMSYMWAIGINQNTAVFLPPPVSEGGYGFGPRSIGYLYFTPIIGVIIGEIIGHVGNDWVVSLYTQRHSGIFVPEIRLTPIYLSVFLTVPGLVLFGQTMHRHLHWLGLVFGWGMYICGSQIFTVAITAYALDSYPNASGEVACLINFSRIIGGFSVGYFQLDWGLKDGFDVSFGIQSAIVGAGIIVIVCLQVFGSRMRAKGGPLRI